MGEVISMIERLMVGLDGSKLAEAVLPLAERFARASGAHLLLVRATTVGATLEVVGHNSSRYLRYSAGVATARSDPAAERAAIGEATSYLAEIAAGLRARGVAVETIVSAGEPAEVLVGQARLRHADLILLATHGRSGLGRLLAGSVAETVLTQSPVPVVLARAETADPVVGAMSGIRLLVPLDGSVVSERALTWVRELADSLAAEVVLTRIVGTKSSSLSGELADFAPPLPSTVPDEDERTAGWYLEGVAEQLRADGLRVTTVLRSDDPAAGILAVARDDPATCIVMGTHGRSGLTRALLGSVALDVLRRGTLPVLLVRPTLHPHHSHQQPTATT
jgi:nucleotide-binding universal stress UspA family protein